MLLHFSYVNILFSKTTYTKIDIPPAEKACLFSAFHVSSHWRFGE